MTTVDVGAQQVGNSSRTTRDRVDAFLRNISNSPAGQTAKNPMVQTAGTVALGAGALVGLPAAVYASRNQDNRANPKGRMAADRVSFGAGAITGQSQERRQPEKVEIGQASDQGALMPQDLSAGYLNLAAPGSPLGGIGLLAANQLRQGQIIQDAVVANQHRQKDAMTIPRGQLSLGAIPQTR